AIAKQHTRTVVENTAGTKQTISLGRNIGAQHARGEIFVFFNADTLVKDIDRFFLRLHEEINGDGIVAVTCSVEVYPDEQRTADRMYHGFYNWLFYMMNQVGMGMG